MQKFFPMALFHIGIVLVFECNAAFPHHREAITDMEQFILPWDGPSAAVFNPALINRTRNVDGRAGSIQSGDAIPTYMQASARIPFGFVFGLSRFSNKSDSSRSNTVYETTVKNFMLGWGRNDIVGTGFGAGLGLALFIHEFNAFGAVKSTAKAYDLGAYGATPPLGRAGILQVGVALRNLYPDTVRLPDDNPGLMRGRYDALLRNISGSLLLKSVLGCADFYAEFNLHEEPHPDGGAQRELPFVKSLGMEYRPFPVAGVKLERTWRRLWTAGLVLYFPVPKQEGLELGAEADISHDEIPTSKDQGRGYIYSLALSISI